MNRFLIAALLFLPAAHLMAQTASDASAEANPVMSALRPRYNQVKGYIIQSAEQMPAEDYAYQPTPEVRSFGEIIDHLTDAHYYMCSMALGEEQPARGESAAGEPTKASRIQALRVSFEYCDQAFQMNDARATRTIQFSGREMVPLYGLLYNLGHDNLHYGNLITYMRINGLVPPSSQTNM